MLSDGSLWTWGQNNDGQLGDGTRTDRPEPVKILDNVMSVAAGAAVAFAIRDDNSLWGWGWNEKGQMADDPPSVDNVQAHLTPVHVMDNIAYVSIMHDHIMAISLDGGLYIWGDNQRGQQGDGTTAPFRVFNAPYKIMENVAAVSGATDHAMALTNDGKLWIWGGNARGRLGNGTISHTPIPRPTLIFEDVKMPVTVQIGGN